MDDTDTAHHDDGFSSQDVYPRPSSSRIHFRAHELSSIRPPRHRSDSQKGHSSNSPPIRRGSPLNPQNVNLIGESKRRHWPPDTLASSDPPLRHRRPTASFNLGGVPHLDAGLRDSFYAPRNELEAGAFSDEYDLSYEDPRILQDVKRALKLKARREARLKQQIASVVPDSISNPPQQLSAPPSSKVSDLSQPLLRQLNTGFSEVDFRPSTATFDDKAQLHPVPSSNDNGVSLDWTRDASEDGEKRWTMGIVRKKDKDRLPPMTVAIGILDAAFKAKITKINSSLSPQTRRKAEITRDQLNRQYSVMYKSLEANLPLNFLAVIRWYWAQQEGFRRSVEKAEPLTWLKHLKKSSAKTTRSIWHLSALMIENHVQGPINHTKHDTITSSHSDSTSFELVGESKLDSRSHHSPHSAFSNLSDVSKGPLNPIPIFAKGIDMNTFNNEPNSPDEASLSSEGSFSSLKELKVEEGSPLVIPEVSVHPPSDMSPSISPKDTSNLIPLSLTLSNDSSASSRGKPPSASAANDSLTSLRTSLKHRQVHASLRNAMPTNSARRYFEEREELLRYEYDAKASLLHEIKEHNQKIRQFLNRMSTTMKDYDAIQSTTINTKGINLPNIPKDLLEAFGHDPSSVTGPTRRLRGWRAVEDIDQRMRRQRSIFRTCIDSFSVEVTESGCVLDDSIGSIAYLLENLKLQKEDIVCEAQSVADLLDSVQDIHAEVKENFNTTLSHVSVVYPELSHIIALEESYKDQYQQFWELGMDTLTLLLDTVTPFWRNYGKTIGEDVRDFLIIPLYRNEFTGEAKSYRITHVPMRSSRHWIGLVVFFFSSIAVNILQLRAAISSSTHFRLQLIPYDGVRWTALPFFWVGIIIQWLAVIFEFAIVCLQLGIIVWWTGWSIQFFT